MTVLQCPTCLTTVPATSYCLQCRAPLDVAHTPSVGRKRATTARIYKVLRVSHESVSKTELKRYDHPLAEHLFPDEELYGVIASKATKIEDGHAKSWKIKPSARQNTELSSLLDDELYNEYITAIEDTA